MSKVVARVRKDSAAVVVRKVEDQVADKVLEPKVLR